MVQTTGFSKRVLPVAARHSPTRHRVGTTTPQTSRSLAYSVIPQRTRQGSKRRLISSSSVERARSGRRHSRNRTVGVQPTRAGCRSRSLPNLRSPHTGHSDPRGRCTPNVHPPCSSRPLSRCNDTRPCRVLGYCRCLGIWGFFFWPPAGAHGFREAETTKCAFGSVATTAGRGCPSPLAAPATLRICRRCRRMKELLGFGEVAGLWPVVMA